MSALNVVRDGACRADGPTGAARSTLGDRN